MELFHPYFSGSRYPKELREAIMTDINDLVQEFLRTSSDVGASFFAMRRLLENLQRGFDYVSVSLIFFFCDCCRLFLADKILQSDDWSYSTESDREMTDKILPLHVEYRKMFDQPLSKSKDLSDMLRILPGVVVQHPVSMQGMADLYRIKPDLFECFIKFTIKDWQPPFHYKLFGFL